MVFYKTLILLHAMLLISSMSWAIKPAVAYNQLGKFDGSINESIYREGIRPYKGISGVDIVEVTPKAMSDYESVLVDLAEKKRSPIIAVGFAYAGSIENVAKRYPDQKFILIDGIVNLPNVQSIVFKEHEGSFLIGAIAAMKSGGNDIAFVGGAEMDFVRRYGCGFAQGAHYINKDITIYSRFLSKDFSGFRDPERAELAGNELIAKGVKVLYAVAGISGDGVYKAASKHDGVYAIGVETNRNYLYVGTILTTMIRNVGGSVLNSLKEAENGQWQAGVKSFGLAENGVGWQLDIFNRDIISKKEESKINGIRDDIISGKIKVNDFFDNKSCSVNMLEI